jgi:hypothetical protein
VHIGKSSSLGVRVIKTHDIGNLHWVGCPKHVLLCSLEWAILEQVRLLGATF